MADTDGSRSAQFEAAVESFAKPGLVRVLIGHLRLHHGSIEATTAVG